MDLNNFMMLSWRENLYLDDFRLRIGWDHSKKCIKGFIDVIKRAVIRNFSLWSELRKLHELYKL